METIFQKSSQHQVPDLVITFEKNRISKIISRIISLTNQIMSATLNLHFSNNIAFSKEVALKGKLQNSQSNFAHEIVRILYEITGEINLLICVRVVNEMVHLHDCYPLNCHFHL